MLHKKGPRDDFADYRALILGHSYKPLSAVVAHKLMDVLEGHLPDTQAAALDRLVAAETMCARSSGM